MNHAEAEYNVETKMDCEKILAEAKKVFEIEIEALEKTKEILGNCFLQILENVIKCSGKVIITGMGKSGHIGTKIATTFSSLGTPSFFMHPAEAEHGDLGMISKDDIVITISYSGESDEIIKILPNIKLIGAKIVAITGNVNSTIAKIADIVQELPKLEEACSLGLAPTSSTTATLCYGDALAVTASIVYGFKDSDYAKLHPSGALGKKLITKVKDLMAKSDDIPRIHKDAFLMEAITEMSEKGLGVVAVVKDDGSLEGIITDGDLRRIIEKRIDIYSEKVEYVMTKNPKRITSNRLVVDALHFIHQNKINNLPVVDDNNCVIGMLTWQMIIKEGIVL